MRLPRVRFTIRWMMVVATIVAVMVFFLVRIAIVEETAVPFVTSTDVRHALVPSCVRALGSHVMCPLDLNRNDPAGSS